MTWVFDEAYTNMGISSVNFGNSETEKGKVSRIIDGGGDSS